MVGRLAMVALACLLAQGAAAYDPLDGSLVVAWPEQPWWPWPSSPTGQGGPCVAEFSNPGRAETSWSLRYHYDGGRLVEVQGKYQHVKIEWGPSGPVGMNDVELDVSGQHKVFRNELVYDGAGRVTEWRKYATFFGSEVLGPVQTYTYDASGTLTGSNEGTVVRENGRVVAVQPVPPVTHTFRYRWEGDRVAVLSEEARDFSSELRYGYDDKGRIVQAQLVLGGKPKTSVSYQWDCPSVDGRTGGH